jgi:hypothetical protein
VRLHGRVRANIIQQKNNRRLRIMIIDTETRTEVAGTAEAHAPRKLTVVENAILTAKVLAGFGLIGAALWGVTLWTSVK